MGAGDGGDAEEVSVRRRQGQGWPLGRRRAEECSRGSLSMCSARVAEGRAHLSALSFGEEGDILSEQGIRGTTTKKLY
jgi:hypothetical protein